MGLRYEISKPANNILIKADSANIFLLVTDHMTAYTWTMYSRYWTHSELPPGPAVPLTSNETGSQLMQFSPQNIS